MVAWVVVVLLFILGIADFVDALTTTHSVWLSIPMLMLSGALLAPAVIGSAALLGLFEFVLEINGHRLVFRRWRRP